MSSDSQFHNIDPESLKNISVQAITQQHNSALDTADYNTPVPTTDQSVPHFVVINPKLMEIIDNKLDPRRNTLIERYRGRIGGC